MYVENYPLFTFTKIGNGASKKLFPLAIIIPGKCKYFLLNKNVLCNFDSYKIRLNCQFVGNTLSTKKKIHCSSNWAHFSHLVAIKICSGQNFSQEILQSFFVFLVLFFSTNRTMITFCSL